MRSKYGTPSLFLPNATKPPESKFPWPLVALAVAVALLIATFWLTPRTNKAATSAINTFHQPASQLRHLRYQDLATRSQMALPMWMFTAKPQIPAPCPMTQAIVSAVFRDKNGNLDSDATAAYAAWPMHENGKVERRRTWLKKPFKPGQTARLPRELFASAWKLGRQTAGTECCNYRPK